MYIIAYVCVYLHTYRRVTRPISDDTNTEHKWRGKPIALSDCPRTVNGSICLGQGWHLPTYCHTKHMASHPHMRFNTTRICINFRLINEIRWSHFVIIRQPNVRKNSLVAVDSFGAFICFKCRGTVPFILLSPRVNTRCVARVSTR